MHLPAYTTTHPSPTSVQITALLLSLAPLWSLSVALYRWPQIRRRLERRRRRSAALSLTQTTTGSVTDLIVPNPDFVPGADPPEYVTGKGAGKGEVAAEHVEATHTRTTALPSGERARPTRARALQSAMRGGRARSRSQDPREQSPSRSRRRTQTSSLLDAVAVPMSTAEEWNELATFGGASSPGS